MALLPCLAEILLLLRLLTRQGKVALGLQLEGSCRLKAAALSSLQRVFPYISAMVNNGSLTYDHSKDGRWTELAGCTADLRNQNHDTFLAIRYSRGRLTVRCGRHLLQGVSHIRWGGCCCVSR